MIKSAPELLHALFQSAVDGVAADACVARHMPKACIGRTVVIGAGKAAAAMARAFERHWDVELEGVVVTRYGHGVACGRIEVLEAGHPVPDEAGVTASRRILEAVQGLSADDLVVCLISGGGSALLTLPAPGVTLADKIDITNQLLHSGASITEINCVRKHLSAIKGGRLALACIPARFVSLIISDVAGDDLASIASGPTVCDPGTYAQARGVLETYAIEVPSAVNAVLQDEADETPKPGDERLENGENILIATAQMALEAAAATARAAGYAPMILSDRIEGEARVVAAEHAATVRCIQPVKTPSVLLSGGETTVTLRSSPGRGGRNTEFLLALALELDGHRGVHAIACDTDGIDGTQDNAGAWIGPDTLARAKSLGLDVRAYLDGHDAYSFFQRLGDLVVSGPTLTNVNDFRAIIVEEPSP